MAPSGTCAQHFPASAVSGRARMPSAAPRLASATDLRPERRSASWPGWWAGGRRARLGAALIEAEPAPRRGDGAPLPGPRPSLLRPRPGGDGRADPGRRPLRLAPRAGRRFYNPYAAWWIRQAIPARPRQTTAHDPLVRAGWWRSSSPPAAPPPRSRPDSAVRRRRRRSGGRDGVRRARDRAGAEAAAPSRGSVAATRPSASEGRRGLSSSSWWPMSPAHRPAGRGRGSLAQAEAVHAPALAVLAPRERDGRRQPLRDRLRAAHARADRQQSPPRAGACPADRAARALDPRAAPFGLSRPRGQLRGRRRRDRTRGTPAPTTAAEREQLPHAPPDLPRPGRPRGADDR